MPNIIDLTGCTIKTLDEIIADLTAKFQQIYGNDIQLDANTPDGQLLQGFAQQILDNLEFAQGINAAFDPDQAIGTTLDQRVALNGIKRQGGTFTLQEVQVTTDRALPLPGLDSAINDPNGVGYTVSDNAGNQFILANSFSVPGTGTYTLTFRAQKMGAVQTTPNTITVPISLIPGVLSVNNPASQPLSVGINQEQDSALKIRRRQSVAISSSGNADAVEAAVANVPGVVYARCYENLSSGVDGDGTPSHSIWVVVEGGADIEVAQAIYGKRSGGCGMRGGTSITVTRTNGLPLVVSFDRVLQERLYAKMTLDSVTGEILTTASTTSGSATLTGIPSTTGMATGMPVRGAGIPAQTYVGTVISSGSISLEDRNGNPVNATATASGVSITVVPIVFSVVQTALAAGLVPAIYQTVDVNMVATVIKAAIPNALVTFSGNQGFSSDGVNYYPQLTPTSKLYQFTLAAGDIAIL